MICSLFVKTPYLFVFVKNSYLFVFVKNPYLFVFVKNPYLFVFVKNPYLFLGYLSKSLMSKIRNHKVAHLHWSLVKNVIKN